MGTKGFVNFVEITLGPTRINRAYPSDDPIFGLPEEKQRRKLIADARRDLETEADRLAQEPITVRG